MKEDSGIILVLLRGGSFTMGAQNRDPSALGYDRHAFADESPPHPVIVSPFFLSKYELTTSQWYRIFAPSSVPQPADGTLPIANVSWHQAVTALDDFGLGLPTEEQWEYACRAGTKSSWFIGNDPRALEEFAVMADSREESVSLARIGTRKPNPFGLHDMYGNLKEWCLSEYFDSFATVSRSGEGRIVLLSDAPRVVRGGAFSSRVGFVEQGAAISLRSAARDAESPDARNKLLGVRPARSIWP